jgi:hypothetical protein
MAVLSREHARKIKFAESRLVVLCDVDTKKVFGLIVECYCCGWQTACCTHGTIDLEHEQTPDPCVSLIERAFQIAAASDGVVQSVWIGARILLNKQVCSRIAISILRRRCVRMHSQTAVRQPHWMLFV